LSAAVIGVSVWFALNPQAWRAFEDRHGPIRAIVAFVLVAAIAVLGLKRTAVAGVLLLVVGVVPLAVSSLGSLLGFASLSVVSAAPAIAGFSTWSRLTWRNGQRHRLTPASAPRNNRRPHDPQRPP
jgi:hypothetical protein